MVKIKIGTIRQKILVEGDANLLTPQEILVTEDEGYTVLRKLNENNTLETFVIVPLKDLK